MLPNPQPYFAALPDPRRETRNKLHKLEDIVMLTLCAILGGYEDWVSIEDFGHENEEWLRQFLELRNGIPSHDTLSDVMGRIDRDAFGQAFAQWVQAGLPSLAEKHVALDGKRLRGSSHGGEVVHLMSAFASEARLVLAVQPMADKGNEISAIGPLLAQLELRGATVTIDAIGCQRSVAETIVKQKADYVLALKDNQHTLCEDVRFFLDDRDAQGIVQRSQTTIEKDHGRIETRRVVLSTDIDWLQAHHAWPGLKAVAMVESERELRGKRSTERRYFLCSFCDVERVAQVIRAHWSIENQQHWILDVQFKEDANQTRHKRAASNLALIRRTALNLLRQDPSTLSMRRRKIRASSNHQYREQLLFIRTST